MRPRNISFMALVLATLGGLVTCATTQNLFVGGLIFMMMVITLAEWK